MAAASLLIPLVVYLITGPNRKIASNYTNKTDLEEPGGLA
jgi:hypothetical protein